MEQITCPQCIEEFINKSNLKRHLLKIHRLPMVESEKLLRRIEEKKGTCDLCEVEVSHMKKHLATKKHQANLKNGSKELTSDICDNKTFFEELQEYMSSVPGNLIKDTVQETYLGKIKSFFKHTFKHTGKFSLGRLILVTSTDKYLPLPSCVSWVTKDFESQRSQSLACVSYIKLVDFVRNYISKNEHLMSDSLAAQRYNYLTRRRDEASGFEKGSSKNLAYDSRVKAREDNILAKDSSQQKISVMEMKTLCDVYRTSPFRQEKYRLLSEMRKVHSLGTISDVAIRNFLVWEVFFEGTGIRPDVVRNMTLWEFVNACETPSSDQGFKTIHVDRHKTQNSAAGVLHMPLQLYTLVEQYIQLVRPCFPGGKEEDPDSYVFLTKEGNQLANLHEPCKVFIMATECGYKLTPYMLRHTVATLGQLHPDPNIGDKLPAHMNHSKDMARRAYMDEKSKDQEHFLMSRKVFGKTQALPTMEEAAQDQLRLNINERKKKKLAEEQVERKKKHFTVTSRRKFSPDDVKVICQTFTSSDGTALKGNLSDKDIADAYLSVIPFNKMVNRLLTTRANLTMDNLVSQLKNSYRYHMLRKNQ